MKMAMIRQKRKTIKARVRSREGYLEFGKEFWLIFVRFWDYNNTINKYKYSSNTGTSQLFFRFLTLKPNLSSDRRLQGMRKEGQDDAKFLGVLPDVNLAVGEKGKPVADVEQAELR